MSSNNKIYFGHLSTGFTLVELMICTLLSTVILTSLIKIYDTVTRTAHYSQHSNKTYEQGLFAIEYITKKIRMAGYQGCAAGAPTSDHTAAGTPPSLSGLVGYEVNTSGTWTPTPEPTITADLSNSLLDFSNGTDIIPKPDSDIISLGFATANGATLASNMADENSNISVNAVTGMYFSQYQLVFLADCNNVDIFKISNSPDNTTNPITIEHTTAGGANVENFLEKPYRVGDQLFQYNSSTFFVADTNRVNNKGDPIYSLFEKDINDNVKEIAQGVEYMQILYGLADSNDPPNISYIKGNTTTPAFDMDKLVSVHIGLLMTSITPIASSDDVKTYRLPGENIGEPSGATPVKHSGGRYMRTALNSIIHLRNTKFN